MSEPLKPCPFCGNAADLMYCEDEDSDNFGGRWIECTHCQCSTNIRFACGDDPIPLLIESWNSRSVPASDVQEGRAMPIPKDRHEAWVMMTALLALHPDLAAAQSPPSRWQELERAKVYQAQLVAGENEGAWRDVDAKIYDCLHPSRRRILFTEPSPPAAAPDAEQPERAK